MKKLFILTVAMLFAGTLMAQPIFDLGIKAGINTSKTLFEANQFTTESVLKTHIGAFGRIGWSKLYLQPEIYYSAKGGDVIEEGMSPVQRVSRFDFSTVDVPLLLGIKVIESGPFNLKIMTGPVFCLMTTKKLDTGDLLDKQYYENHYMGYQYGLGVDFLSFFLDARMEHSLNNFYSQAPEDIDAKLRTFMLTLGIKIF